MDYIKIVIVEINIHPRQNNRACINRYDVERDICNIRATTVGIWNSLFGTSEPHIQGYSKLENNPDITTAPPIGLSSTAIHNQSTQFTPVSFLTQNNTKYGEYIANKPIIISTAIASPRPPAQV